MHSVIFFYMRLSRLIIFTRYLTQRLCSTIRFFVFVLNIILWIFIIHCATKHFYNFQQQFPSGILVCCSYQGKPVE